MSGIFKPLCRFCLFLPLLLKKFPLSCILQFRGNFVSTPYYQKLPLMMGRTGAHPLFAMTFTRPIWRPFTIVFA